jgi:TonB family protein
MTEPIRPLFFWSLGASILLHLLCAIVVWKTYVPAPDLQDSAPLMIRLLRSSDIPKFIDQPNAAKATQPVRSKDISQVTSEARGRGRIPGPGTSPKGEKTQKGGEAQAQPSPLDSLGKSHPSLREQVASLGTLGLSGDEGVSETGEHGETGADERTISLETRSSEFAPYLAEVKRRVVRWWYYPPYARQVGLGGELVLVFGITRDGNLAAVRITKSSGVSLLDEAAVKAVEAGAPFAHFPANFAFRQLNIVASFNYIAKPSPGR